MGREELIGMWRSAEALTEYYVQYEGGGGSEREYLVAESAHICAILSECVSSCTADEKEGESCVYMQ